MNSASFRKTFSHTSNGGSSPPQPSPTVSSDLTVTSGEATSRVVALKSAAETVKGTFRFPIRRAIDDGTYSVFGVCEG